MPDRFINWGLMANPANWFVVFLMLAVGSIAVTAVYASWSSNQG